MWNLMSDKQDKEKRDVKNASEWNTVNTIQEGMSKQERSKEKTRQERKYKEQRKEKAEQRKREREKDDNRE